MSDRFEHELKQRKERVPRQKDWEALQGGKPRIFFRPPQKRNIQSNGIFYVAHIYGKAFQEPKSEMPSHYGLIVPTPFDQMKNSIVSPDLYEVPVNRLINVPSALVAQRHGVPCLEESIKTSPRFNDYEKSHVQTAAAFNDIREKWRMANVREMELATNDHAQFTLRAIGTTAIRTV